MTKVQFLISPSGAPFFLAYNAGEFTSVPDKLATELVRAKVAVIHEEKAAKPEPPTEEINEEKAAKPEPPTEEINDEKAAKPSGKTASSKKKTEKR